MALQRLLLKTTLWLARGDQRDYGVPLPRRPPLAEHPTVSQDLLALAGRGAIHFKPNIREFEGKTIVFEDGSSEEADLVIYATGYQVSVPFFEPDFLNLDQQNNLELYQRVVHPDHPGLYFLAFIQPLRAIMPLAEIQAKWIAKLLTSECRLPEREAMRRAIEIDWAALRRRYSQSPRHTFQVEFHPYRESPLREMKRMKVR